MRLDRNIKVCVTFSSAQDCLIPEAAGDAAHVRTDNSGRLDILQSVDSSA